MTAPGVLRAPVAQPAPSSALALLGTATGAEPEALQAQPVATVGTEKPVLAAARLEGLVRGRLTDAAGAPVGGEPVALFLLRDRWEPRPDEQDPVMLSASTSDKNGAFELPARAHARMKLLAGGDAWARVAEEPVVAGDDLTVRMEGGLVLRGAVRAAEDGRAVPDAWVLAGRNDILYLGRTDETGAFALGPLDSADHLLGSWAPGFSVRVMVPVSPLEPSLAVELPPAVALRGVVRDTHTGAPVEGAELRLTLKVLTFLAGELEAEPQQRLVEERTALTGEDGAFLLEDAPGQGFVLLATAPGYVPQTSERWKDKPFDPEQPIQIDLVPALPLQGFAVLALNGAPAVGAHVVLESEDGPVDRGTVAPDGSFSLATAAWDGTGRLHVQATDDQGRSARARLRLSKRGQRGPMALPDPLRLVDPLSVAVRVVREEGDSEGLSGASVAVWSQGTEPSIARTDAQGLAHVLHPLAGPDTSSAHVQARHGPHESLPHLLAVGVPALHAVGGPLVLAVEGGAWLRGRVADPFDHPVASALLSTRKGPMVHSDREGRFRLGPFEVGRNVGLKVTAAGYRTLEQTVVPAPDDLWLTLQPLVQWSGRAVDAASGLPLERVDVRLERQVLQDGALRFTRVKTHVSHDGDGSGGFTLDLTEPGDLRLRVFLPDYMPTITDPVAFDGLRSPPFVNAVLSRAAVLELEVLDDAGRAVPGYGVTAVPWRAGGDPRRQAARAGRKKTGTRHTDEQGLVRFHLGEGGFYRLASGRDHWLEPAGIPVTPGPPVRRTYRLGGTGALTVRLVADPRLPLADARVRLRSSRKDRSQNVQRQHQTVRRAGDGTTRFEVLPPGPYEVIVTRRGSWAREQVEVLAYTNRQLEVQLLPREKPRRQRGGPAQGRDRAKKQR